MFDLGLGRRPVVAAVAAVLATVVLLAGCSSQESVPPLPVAPTAPAAPPAPPLATGLPGETSPAALSVAEAVADPVRGVVLAAGDPARCLESQGSSRTVLDGRAVLGDCRAVAGQVWSLAPSAPATATTPTPGRAPAPTPAPTPAGPDAATYRLANTTRGPDPLCFEGAPRVARDGAANTACRDLAAQSWHVVPTSAGFYRLRTDADAGRCLGTVPTAPGAPRAEVPGVAMVPCEPLERPLGSPRSTQDWELLPAPPLPAPPPPTSRPAPAPKPTAPRPSGVVGALLANVNAQRATAGCGPLRSDATLVRAAQKHAQWMNSGGAFSHTGQGGSSPKERIRGEGWNGASTGENIAEGQTSVDEVMTDWMNSPGHRRNILDCDFTSIGLAKTGSMWVQDFGGN